MECKCNVSGLRQGPSSIPHITAGPVLGRLGLRQTWTVQGAARSDLMVSAAHFQESCIPGKLIRLPTPPQISPCPYGQAVQSQCASTVMLGRGLGSRDTVDIPLFCVAGMCHVPNSNHTVCTICALLFFSIPYASETF